VYYRRAAIAGGIGHRKKTARSDRRPLSPILTQQTQAQTLRIEAASCLWLCVPRCFRIPAWSWRRSTSIKLVMMKGECSWWMSPDYTCPWDSTPVPTPAFGASHGRLCGRPGRIAIAVWARTLPNVGRSLHQKAVRKTLHRAFESAHGFFGADDAEVCKEARPTLRMTRTASPGGACGLRQTR